MRKNIGTLIVFLILFATTAELSQLPAQLDDSQKLEQLTQRVSRLEKWDKTSDPILDAVIAAVIAAVISVIFRGILGYEKRIAKLEARLNQLEREVYKLAGKIENLWIFIIFQSILIVIFFILTATGRFR